VVVVLPNQKEPTMLTMHKDTTVERREQAPIAARVDPRTGTIELFQLEPSGIQLMGAYTSIASAWAALDELDAG